MELPPYGRENGLPAGEDRYPTAEAEAATEAKAKVKTVVKAKAHTEAG